MSIEEARRRCPHLTLEGCTEIVPALDPNHESAWRCHPREVWPPYVRQGGAPRMGWQVIDAEGQYVVWIPEEEL